MSLLSRGRKACFHSFRKTFNTVLQRENKLIFEVMRLIRVSDRKRVDLTYCDGRVLLQGGEKLSRCELVAISAPTWALTGHGHGTCP